jgi:hypothetical protein
MHYPELPKGGTLRPGSSPELLLEEIRTGFRPLRKIAKAA